MSSQGNKTNNNITISKEEKIAVIDLFKSDLSHLLTSKNKELTEGLNLSIIVLLFQDSSFKKLLVDIILSNKEEITSNKIMIGGKIKSPTIANWVNDFVKNVGVSDIDSLKISNFLVYGDNVRKISDNEKNILRKLLTLYKNLKFFPESMGDSPVDEWEIIPVTGKEKLSKARDVGNTRFDIANKERPEYRGGEREGQKKTPITRVKSKNNDTVGGVAKKEIVANKDKDKIGSKEKNTDNFFSNSENDEVRKLIEKAKTLKTSVNTTIDFDKEVTDLLSGIKVGISDENIKTRLKNVVMSSVRGVRSIIDTRDMLSRSVESGGVGLDVGFVDTILSGIKSKRAEIGRLGAGVPPKEGGEKTVKKDSSKILMPPPPTIKKSPGLISPPSVASKSGAKKDVLIPEKKEAFIKKEDFKKTSLQKNNYKPIKPDVLQPIKQTTSNMVIEGVSRKKEVDNNIKNVKKIKSEKQGFFSKLFRKNKKKHKKPVNTVKTNNKVKMQDVRKAPVPQQSSDVHKLIGPVEELGGLSIGDFRDWSDDPSMAIKNVERKIDNLAKVSLTKKISGIKAWRGSEMYKLYLTVLNSAVLNNVSVDDVIKRLKDERRPTISKAEFEAISGLSNKLRF